ncbi:GDP/GTP exchange factor for ARF [Tulasnella sp. 418]|nr:GDP/GTP exchange factor for ARF [Tulasnella sp. 418]
MADTNQNHGGALRLAVSPSHLVFSEILSVTSAMRKNSRWASSQPGPTRGTGLASTMGLRPQQNVSVKSGRAVHDRQETILLWDFEKLKRSIRDNEDIMSLPLTTILSPFLALIRSPLSTGPITSTALASIQAFFTAGLITPNSPNVEPALIDLSNALAHCKFEASDSSSDEVVLLRILTIINSCLASAVGETVGDVEVCEMLETVLTICCQMRLSETLRKNAENTMGALGRHVFSRLDSLRPEDDTEDAEASKPYGLPSVQELLRVLVNLLDPTDQQHTDSIRLTALGILQAALEFSGSRIGLFPSLADMILDQGCKFLLQLARSDNTSILHLSLRVLSVVFHTMRGQLKLQTELFLSFAIDRLAPPVIVIPPKVQLSLNSGAHRKNVSLPGTPTVGSTSSVSGDPSMDPLLLDDQGNEEDTPPPSKPRVPPARGLTRELLLETLGNLARQPSFMVDLWVNYDCDASCEDLFDRLVQFMTRGVYPTQYVGGLETQRYASQLLCLDSVLSYVHHMNARAEGPVGDWPDSNPQPDALNLQKSTKRLILTGASRFNTKPKTGFAYFEEHGLIYKKEYEDQGLTRPEILAMFLKNTPRLDKKVLGDWISAPENIEVLRAFIKLLDFKGKSIADAMRVLVEAFRLPGEAAPIGRVTETFAEIYFATKPPEIKSTDAVYVLAYSVILLNTDLYNPQNRKRMTIEDYKRNLRGVNDGEDFDPDYLQGVYDSIKKREIIMPEEHTGQLGFEYAWKALLLRTKAAGL